TIGRGLMVIFLGRTFLSGLASVCLPGLNSFLNSLAGPNFGTVTSGDGTGNSDLSRLLVTGALHRGRRCAPGWREDGIHVVIVGGIRGNNVSGMSPWPCCERYGRWSLRWLP